MDIEKWREAKDVELSIVMRRVADGHIKYHQKVWGGGPWGGVKVWGKGALEQGVKVSDMNTDGWGGARAVRGF